MADTIIRPPINPVQPGAYSAVDASALSSPGVRDRLPVVAVVGTAEGGAPNVPLYFRGPGPLKQVLRGGDAYDAARFVFSSGASSCAVVRVGVGVAQAHLDLDGATGTPITLTSLDYGAWCNSIQVAVGAANLLTITFTDAFGNVYTEEYAGLTSLEDVVAAVNGLKYGYSKSQFVAATAGTGTLPLDVLTATPLAGGSDGTTPDANAWADGLTALEPEDVDILVPVTDDATIHAQFLAHCNAMSEPLARKERVTVVGGTAAEDAADQVTRIGNLRDKRVQLVYPGITDFADDGSQVAYAAPYAAAKVAGLHAAQDDEAVSLCHKRVPIVDVERKLSTIQGGDLDTLLRAGVTPIAAAPGSGFWVVDSLSGWNTDDTFNDFHKIRSADQVAQRARWRLESKFVGSKGLMSTANEIVSEAKDVLRDLEAETLIAGFLDPTVAPASAARTYNVTLPVLLVEATKFIFISVALQPSAALSSQVGMTAPDTLT